MTKLAAFESLVLPASARSDGSSFEVMSRDYVLIAAVAATKPISVSLVDFGERDGRQITEALTIKLSSNSHVYSV
jgi:hypothetical protein